LKPSYIKEANASASAVPQSIPFPFSILSARALKILIISLWKLLSFGNAVMALPIYLSLSSGIPDQTAYF
jgi:hypothetical protein